MTENNQKILMLIDGNALVYRSFYGLPPLTTKDGIQVNAVYGFASSIFHALEKFHPEYICVAFDVSKKTWRNKEYPEYKANRIKAPQELYDQLPLVKEVCNVLNIPQFGVKDYEADDVIGTISAKISNFQFPISNEIPKFKIQNSKKLTEANEAKKLKTIIVTGDMDTLQLVNDSTEVYSVSRGIKRAEIFDENKVREKYSFDPKYLVDYKALRGDPSDNIPGVAGIGEKTATKLVQNFGSIENLYHTLECHSEGVPVGRVEESLLKSDFSTPSTSLSFESELEGSSLRVEDRAGSGSSRNDTKMLQVTDKIKNLLLQYKNQAFLSKKLATIVKDVPIDFNLSFCKVSDYDKISAEKLFRKLEFKSLIKRLPEMKSAHTQKSLF